MNGLFNIANYCYTALAPTEAALALDVPSTEQLLRMRAQAEKLAAQDRLFARKDPNLVDWPTVQQGRIKCLAAWEAGRRKPHAERQKLLREVVAMLFFSVQPPDRGALHTPRLPAHMADVSTDAAPAALRAVGIIRRLRFHQSVKANGDGFDMDLSHMRFKNSKFFGPCAAASSLSLSAPLQDVRPHRPQLSLPTCRRTVTSISPLITPYLRLYLKMLEFDTVAGDPYLFSPASDVTRAMTSSQWSAYAKGIVKRWTGIAAPPKTMRRVAAPSTCCRWDLRSRLARLLPACQSLLHHLHEGPHRVPQDTRRSRSRDEAQGRDAR